MATATAATAIASSSSSPTQETLVIPHASSTAITTTPVASKVKMAQSGLSQLTNTVLQSFSQLTAISAWAEVFVQQHPQHRSEFERVGLLAPASEVQSSSCPDAPHPSPSSDAGESSLPHDFILPGPKELQPLRTNAVDPPTTKKVPNASQSQTPGDRGYEGDNESVNLKQKEIPGHPPSDAESSHELDEDLIHFSPMKGPNQENLHNSNGKGNGEGEDSDDMFAPPPSSAAGTACGLYKSLDLDRGQWNIWEDDQERKVAEAIHKSVAGRRNATPNLFKHGLRHVRQIATGKGDVKHLQCRCVIISELPRDVHLGAVLDQVRGGTIINARITQMSFQDGLKSAIIHFANARSAYELFSYYNHYPLLFASQGENYRAVVNLSGSQTYPMSQGVEKALLEKRTRRIQVDGIRFEPLRSILRQYGLRRRFGNMLTGFVSHCPWEWEITFGNLLVACRVAETISILHGSTKVQFLPDPCEGPISQLIGTKQPINATTDDLVQWLSLLDESTAIGTQDNDPLDELSYLGHENSSMTLECREDIHWYKTADWDAPDIERWIATDNDGQTCQYARDPCSGAECFRRITEDGSLAEQTFDRKESIKEWLHYNLDAKDHFTQETLDMYFKSHGLLNLRKIQQYVDIRDVNTSAAVA